MNNMLTFKQYLYEQFLILEDRLSKIKEIFKDKIDTSHDALAQHKDSDAIVDHFATHADPTQNKAHTQWIVGRYREGEFRQEDHPRIREALSTFDRPAVKAALKASKKPTDINQYKSLSDLEDAVEPHKEAISGKQEEKKIKSEGADLIHNDKDLGVTVHHIKTEEASCSYGAGTRWCTAGEKKNDFHRLNKQGPIHIIQHQGRKYQFHIESNQFMDEKNNPTDLTKVHPDIAKSLSKSNHPKIIKANFLFKNPNIKPEHITKALDDEDEYVRLAAVKHPKFGTHPDHITKALDDEDEYVREAAVKHPNATPDHITKALDDEDEYVRLAAVKHPKFGTHPDHITKALNDKNSNVRLAAVKHPNATPDHITKALDDEDEYVRKAAIQHPNFGTHPDHITKALDDKNSNVRLAAVKHPKFGTHPDHITKALDDKNLAVREVAVKHPNATPDHITKALDDKNEYVRKAAVKHPKFGTHPDHMPKALDDENEYVREEAVKHPNATPEHITKALDDEDEYVRLAAVKHPNATPDHITKALDDERTNVRRAAIEHPNATPDHITKALDDENEFVRKAAIEKRKTSR
jgi:HEAT repeat protein